MRELRRLHRALIEVFESRGYGEVATPAIEYDEVLARGDGRTADSAYRFFDERGDLLALRSDMTVPIARLVASRFASAEPPLRLCYLANAYRAVRPQRGQMREFAQAGVELIGRAGAAGHRRGGRGAGGGARRRRAGPRRDRPRRRRPLPPAARRAGVEGAARDSILERLATHDLVGLEAELSELEGIGDEQCATCVALSQLRGGSEVLEQARGPRRGRRSSGPRRGSARPSRSWRRAASPTGSRSTSACSATSATTAARSSRSTTRRSATCSAAAAATTAC